MKQESVLSAHPVSDDMRALIAEKLRTSSASTR